MNGRQQGVGGVVFVPVKDVTYAGQQLDTTIAFVERAGLHRDITTRNLSCLTQLYSEPFLS